MYKSLINTKVLYRYQPRLTVFFQCSIFNVSIFNIWKLGTPKKFSIDFQGILENNIGQDYIGMLSSTVTGQACLPAVSHTKTGTRILITKYQWGTEKLLDPEDVVTIYPDKKS